MKSKHSSHTTYMIHDLETLKTLTDPLRYQILEILAVEPLTVRQVAEKLGLQPLRLYYHINLLEKHNLIQVVETRQLGNILEKYYSAVADDFEIDRDFLSFGTAEGRNSIENMISTTINAAREEMLRSLDARNVQLEQGYKEKPREFQITKVSARLTDERARQFQERAKELLREFKEADTEPSNEDLQPFSFMVALYPLFYYPEEEHDEEGDR